MRPFLKISVAVLSLTAAAVHAASIDDGAALLRKVDDIRAPGADFAFTVTLSTGDASQTMSVSVKDKTKALVRYVAPANMVGRAILFVGRNMWIVVPGTRRALRITPRQRLLGGVSTADVARTVYSEDYEVAAATPSGNGHLLRLTPTTGAYARIDLAVDGRGAPQTAEFFANGGRKIKTMTFGGYRTVLGDSRPTRMAVIDHVNGAETVMVYSNFRRIETPEAFYQPSYLSRL